MTNDRRMLRLAYAFPNAQQLGRNSTPTTRCTTPSPPAYAAQQLLSPRYCGLEHVEHHHMPVSASRPFWILVVALLLNGAWSGWQLPSAEYGQAFPAGVLGWSLAVVPGVVFAVLGFTRQSWKTVPYPALEHRADRILGQGTYAYLFLSGGVLLILGTAAALSGMLGLGRSVWFGLTGSPMLTSVFMLSAGTGMLCAFIGQRRFRARTE